METINSSKCRETAYVKFFITITEFFTFSTPQQHLKLLDHWRYLISVDQFYNRSNSPADLLYKYRAFTGLYEAASGVYLSACSGLGKLSGTIQEQQFILEEEKQLDFYPMHLEPIFLAEPFGAIEQIFSRHDITFYKDQLFEWLVDGLSGHYPQDSELSAGPLYNCTVQLIEASWLIYIRNQAF